MTNDKITFERLPATRWLYGYTATRNRVRVEFYRVDAGRWDVYREDLYRGRETGRCSMVAENVTYAAARAAALQTLRETGAG